MKLRIKGNSFRLRITPSEMSQLIDSGRIEDTIYFGIGDQERFTWGLEHNAQSSAMTVRSEPQAVTIVISSEEAHRWAQGRDVGLYGHSDTSHGPLEIAVEKDFACLDKDEAANADTYPNPKQGAVC